MHHTETKGRLHIDGTRAPAEQDLAPYIFRALGKVAQGDDLKSTIVVLLGSLE
jgi:hypothetical protein